MDETNKTLAKIDGKCTKALDILKAMQRDRQIGDKANRDQDEAPKATPVRPQTRARTASSNSEPSFAAANPSSL